MRAKAIHLLNWLLKLFVEEAIRPYILFLLSGGTLWAFLQTLYSRGATTGQDIWQTPPMRWSLLSWLLLAAALVSLFAFLYFLRRVVLQFFLRKPYHFAFEQGLELDWKYDIRTGIVEGIPYCPKNRVKLRELVMDFERRVFVCPVCQKRWPVMQHEATQTYEDISNLTRAKLAGHFRK